MLKLITSLDPILLARIQFAFTISFHIIFPALSIGLASFLFFIEMKWFCSKDPKYDDLYRFWSKIFAVSFGMGVVSGVVMSYQFGTNWSHFSDKVGNVIGPLLGFEVLTAFFLEATFLGIMLFGRNRVSDKMHLVATGIVAFGTIVSAFWIIAVNSWMQTPAGFFIAADGRFYPNSWLDIVFTPSFWSRLLHMITAAFLTVNFVVGGVSALSLLRNKDVDHAKITLRIATIFGCIAVPLQIFFGDMSGLEVFHHQPRKLAAIEGIWETDSRVPITLFGIPNEEKETTDYALQVPLLGSIILTHDINGTVRGLKEWKKDDRPPVAPVFWSFRIMVGMGLLMLLLSFASAIALCAKKLFHSRFLHIAWTCMIPSGFIAVLTGWFVTEIGRQPYIVYEILKTKDVATPTVTGGQAFSSLLGFVIVYSFVFASGVYYIYKIVNKGFSSSDVNIYHEHSREAALTRAITDKKL